MNSEDHKQISRGISTDMTPSAILRRLRIVGELYRANTALSSAKLVFQENTANYASTDKSSTAPREPETTDENV